MKKNIDWDRLRDEYDVLRSDGKSTSRDWLRWCTRKARECGMSYGKFVLKLGR